MQAFRDYLSAQSTKAPTLDTASKGPTSLFRDGMTLESLDQNEKSGFKLFDKRDLIQYATFYFKRLSLVKDYVYLQCKKKWQQNNGARNSTSLS